MFIIWTSRALPDTIVDLKISKFLQDQKNLLYQQIKFYIEFLSPSNQNYSHLIKEPFKTQNLIFKYVKSRILMCVIN